MSGPRGATLPHGTFFKVDDPPRIPPPPALSGFTTIRKKVKLFRILRTPFLDLPNPGRVGVGPNPLLGGGGAEKEAFMREAEGCSAPCNLRRQRSMAPLPGESLFPLHSEWLSYLLRRFLSPLNSIGQL